MTKISADSIGRIGRTVAQAVGAAVVAAPVVVGALGLSAGRAAAVEAVVASFVAVVSAAQNVAEDFGWTPPWGKVDLPAPAAPVPPVVAADIARAETVAKAAGAVEAAAKGKPKA